MSGFDDREKAQESKFAHMEEVKFKISSRRRKLLGLWAADKMGMSEVESLEYAMNVVKTGLNSNDSKKIISKILADFETNGATVSEKELVQKDAELAIEAERQVKEDVVKSNN